MAHRVRLEVFEGPLDLLLYLIKREELDICDIPIAHITDEYLQALKMMELLNLDLAGEFLVMAATLMQIKSRMLLPAEEAAPEGEEEDPRADLMAQLLEYKRFKEAAEVLRGYEERRHEVFPRTASADEGEYLLEASMFDLLGAVGKVLERAREEPVTEISAEEVTVEEKIKYLLDLLRERSAVTFGELFAGIATRVEIIATFLALLELVRLGEARARQVDPFGEIRIMGRKRCAGPDAVVASGTRASAGAGAHAGDTGGDTGMVPAAGDEVNGVEE